MNSVNEMLKKISPIPTIVLTKDNAVRIIKAMAKKGMCYAKSVISPEVAQELLTLEKDNRKRTASTVKTYARYMMLNKWRLIPDPIAFDSSPELIDGGHSLSSVIASNVPSIFTICSGAPKDAKEAMDQILPRTVLDVIGFQDKKYRLNAKTIHIAVIRSMLLESPASTKIAVPKLELAEFIKIYFDSADKIISIFGASHSTTKIRNASLIAPIVRAYEDNKGNLTILARFIGILTGDIRSDKHEDDAAYKLRDWFLCEMGSKKTRPLKRVIYRKTDKALSLFIQGKTCGILTEANIEHFPLAMNKNENLSTYLDNSKSMEKKHGNQRKTRKKTKVAQSKE